MIPRYASLKRTGVRKSEKTKERSALIKECDALCSKLAIARDRCCVACGGDRKLMCAHILPKGNTRGCASISLT